MQLNSKIPFQKNLNIEENSGVEYFKSLIIEISTHKNWEAAIGINYLLNKM